MGATATLVGQPDDFDREAEVVVGLHLLEQYANRGSDTIQDVGRGTLAALNFADKLRPTGRRVGSVPTGHLFVHRPVPVPNGDGTYSL